MTHASLFSGIGGFDLAAERMGWNNVFNCEINPFCRKVLAYHFPNAKQYEDVKAVDFTIYRGHVDVLTGGFPCQPFSLAGKRRGTEDNRYLWGEMLRAIKEIEPRWVVGENVLGIVSWSDGMVFEQVQSDLEDAGYEVQPYIIPACAVDAPHRRERVWFVAHRSHDRFGRTRNSKGCGVSGWCLLSHEPQGCEVWGEPIGCAGERITSNSESPRLSSRSPRPRKGESGRVLRRGGGTSQNSQLSPLFVAEMMGFPIYWTLAPFLSGLTSTSDGDSAVGGEKNQ